MPAGRPAGCQRYKSGRGLDMDGRRGRLRQDVYHTPIVALA